MHSVERSPEPNFLARMRTEKTTWDDLDTSDRVLIRGALARDFERTCAYCERDLDLSTGQATIEHFRPRSRFPDMAFDWLNLIYACRRCNDAKGNSWPGFDDQDVDTGLKAMYPRYSQVSEYVSPNSEAGRLPAQEYFSYDVETGEILPAERLGDEEWSMACRTIVDIDLNDEKLGEYDPDHLWNRRKRRLRLLIERLNAVQDPFRKIRLAREFMMPDKPYSSFVAAYFKHHFPEL